jgi:ectoine hydroxylase-related dioxygenase (phytanoyl-CoA dioxygenase family)
MLTDAEVAHYHEHGYVIPDFRLPPATVAAIRADHDRLLARHPEFRNYCSRLLEFDLSFLNYARIPEVLDMVGQVIGPDFALWNSSFFAKPAHDGHATPWHQDGEYWPIRPLATCTVWIAVDAATTENGCLRIIPGSHKDRRLRKHHTNKAENLTLNQELEADEYDLDSAVDLVLDEGQVSLHDVYLLHGSEANTSARPRRGMTLRYMPTSSVFDREVAHDIYKRIGQTDHAHRTLYLMRGRDLSGRNDFAMRR